MSGAESRLAAAELLHLTLDKRRTLDEAMTLSDTYNALEGSDRGFARAIASAALRHLGWIDQTVQPFLSRPLAATGVEIRALIRAGAAQIWFLDVAPHAAVNATVDAARLSRGSRSGGSFLNAALRRVSEAPPPAASLAPEDIWPAWLRGALVDSLGADGARRLATSEQAEPALHLTAAGSPADLAARIGGQLLASGSVKAPGGAVEDLPGYAEGEWWVQDQAAALPARLLNAAPGESVLDLCAAPGGKTLQLAATGAHVTALDRSAPRLERLRENLERTGLKAEVIVADAEAWAPGRTFQKILLDAPCSALGTLRRHPEGAWIKTAADVARFPGVQARLLAAAAGLLAPGGTLIYCVCSPLAAEGRDVVNAALTSGLLARRPVTAAECAGFEDCVTPEGDVLTLPGPSRDCDAFYIARLAAPAN
ncbi:MAG: methyltransferase domain-containing protein [Hyphomonas sp.]|uniref:RsmB/NOP family class I SAM-dependent RNA methyltransferase n=1 Tax=Hyphomonas sp. TaxID=87 RepID=UPI0017DC5DC4|nr:transcription antitermination factor NusB [Hyphomonas sp.]MBA3069054.1 methyltransferase domain-containing protein [Hyphomonas sp.]MBU4061688.1 methyltransferase domain-containing protein [Alphaproteobacteria bacterium]MBU4163533.1 methyltransferase domain-containing protein [Alphaproteobacteria bacterium]MBU4568719.1 methyltransferase domain-containing protein [Alphaproteobacteria bacterium]